MFSLLTKPRSKAGKSPKPLRKEERLLSVGDRSLPLTIREHARATRMTLRIEPGGRALRLTVPTGLRAREIDAFLARHDGWLRTKLSKFSNSQALGPGGTLLLRGVAHRIVHTGTLRGLTEVAEEEGEPVIRVSGLEGHLGRRLEAFLKKEARYDLERLSAIYAGRIGKPIKSVTMKDTRSRWGSCTWDGSLSFSWRIVMAPDYVIDYLAAHEVAHLREMNHGPQFWALCASLCPDMERARRWLKAHGSQLHAIDFS
ncbi:M48 family metallopeptidase [Rhizobium sp. SSA_523]|uniref:M48 family metallopeptidase n=1 Tax=Rhizobium sp. SSA_523 TaxID=2952477 RepID=UPI00209052BD|nr:M48 family metallopeptidase [Rhizobium sp. SSA_523]MCO5734634.1 M48 family metallopeptidase [Rhizobium sp. SSA_523]WKC23407.1 M48 family metallopeptidase [Rhizobium sp. SSA_523]